LDGLFLKEPQSQKHHAEQMSHIIN